MGKAWAGCASMGGVVFGFRGEFLYLSGVSFFCPHHWLLVLRSTSYEESQHGNNSYVPAPSLLVRSIGRGTETTVR